MRYVHELSEEMSNTNIGYSVDENSVDEMNDNNRASSRNIPRQIHELFDKFIDKWQFFSNTQH